MNSVSSEDLAVLVLADDPPAAGELLDTLQPHVIAPADADGDDLSAADVVVVRDDAGVDRIRGHDGARPVIASVDDPTCSVATDAAVDAVATTPAELETATQWLAARSECAPVREAVDTPPQQIERLTARATRLASVTTVEAAHRAAIAVADAVFPSYHCLIGVRDGEWVEPVAASADVPVGDCNRVRVGNGAAGTVVETGVPAIAPAGDRNGPYDTLLTVPVDDDTVIQFATDDSEGFDEADRRLAELFASHVEETIDRILTNEALRTERDRLLALFSNIPDSAIAYDYVDGEPVVRRVNDAFEETFGYSAETVVGESIDEYIVPATDEAVRQAKALNERLRRGENVRREVTRETADGARHFILHVVPIRLDAENASGYAIYTDVTEHRERESTLRRQNERLDEFASIVSHDLRNPLSVAQGYVDLAEETDDPEHLAKAVDALDRMDELVGELLSLARQGRAVGETEPVSIAAIARDAWESVETAGAELVVDTDVRVEASPTRTRELLENVFRNSIEHGGADRGGTADPLTVRVGEVTYRDGTDPGAEGFFIEDDGAGLPDDAVDRVFESGFTTDADGTGIGLAITERIADAHGWQARALSGESGGARFEFRTA